MKNTLASTLLFSTTLILGACGGAPPPEPAAPPAAVVVPVAVDRGQPKMEAALGALRRAQGEVASAEPNKGGHRENALGLIVEATNAVNKGIEYANAHATEEGVPEGPAAPEPVDEEVGGGGGQPHMSAGIVALREARRQLREARHDKGGFRDQAIALIDQAIVQLKEGIRYANHH